MRMNIRGGLAALTFGLTTLAAFAQTTPPPAPAALPAGSAAVVKGQVITEIAVWRGLQGIEPERRDKARSEILNLFIENAILDQYVLQMQVKVTKEEIDKKLVEGREELKKAGKDFDKMMKELKLTDAEMREQVAANIRWDKFTETQVTPKVLQDLFNAEKDFFNGARVRARHILLSPPANDPKAVEAAIAQLRAMKQQIETKVAAALAALPPNTDNLQRERERIKVMDKEFADLASEKSVCPSKEVGGDLQYFPRDGMVEPFSRAAFALQPYQMSDVVQSPFGYHLILVTDRKAGADVKFEDAKDQVRELFCLRLRDAIVAKYKPSAKITIAPAPPPETPAKP
jgi:peptidyl-prolyl cis-trans isomerase C